MSRPSYAQVLDYRARIDDALLQRLQAPLPDAHAAAIELGCQHEQQHQELILTDILHALAHNPLQPALRDLPKPASGPASALALRSEERPDGTAVRSTWRLR